MIDTQNRGWLYETPEPISDKANATIDTAFGFFAGLFPTWLEKDIDTTISDVTSLPATPKMCELEKKQNAILKARGFKTLEY